MKTKRASQIKEHAKNNLIDIYGCAKCFKSPSTEITRKFNELKRNLPASTPYWVRAYLNGYRDALTDALYSTDLEFCYLMEGGELVSTWRQSSRYYEKMGFTVCDLIGRPNGHYWIDSDRPYFID